MISIKGVAKRFPNERDINYKDMNFEDGKSYMLLGASGCGKSTLLNMIAGILSPESGEILIDGTDMTQKSQKEKDKFRIKNIGYIFQDFKLIPEMTVIDNINILRLERVDTSRADEILGKLGMLEKKNKKIKHTSGRRAYGKSEFRDRRGGHSRADRNIQGQDPDRRHSRRAFGQVFRFHR